MQSLHLIVAILGLVLLPFSIAFDFIPPPLIPLTVPLSLTAIFGTTGPVSFLVLGPSRAETAETCEKLVHSFSLLRSAAALNPLSLGAILDHQLGPSGNVWMSEGGEPWQHKVKRLIEDAPLVIFDGRKLTSHTIWEIFHLLSSGQLCKVVVVGPVEGFLLPDFLHRSDLVPAVTLDLLPGVLRAAATRPKLLSWYGRRRRTIHNALVHLARDYPAVPNPKVQVDIEVWARLRIFLGHLPEITEMYSLQQIPSPDGAE
jgi:hypothetical protein